MDIPGDLVNKIADGNCVVFVGSGLSMGAGLPDWKGLLRQMIDWAVEHGVEIPDREELESSIDDGELLMVAEEMRERMKDDFGQFMVEVFCNPDLKPTEAHKQIPRIDFAAALTSNYDELLELAYEEAQGKLPRVFTHSNPADLSTALGEKSFYIFKVHGTIRDIDTIVLKRGDYRQLMYNNPAYQQYLNALFLTNTVLFLGFSLTDHDLMSLMDELITIFEGHIRPHYSLMNVRPTRINRFERDYNIRVISYGDHSEVPVFLSELAERLKQPEREELEEVVITPALERPSEIPELPSYFLERPKYLEAIKRSVLAGVGRIAAITGKPVGLHGMGGIGKSMLAAAVARDGDVQKAFPDGIVWLSVGQEPNIVVCQRQVAIALGDNPPPFEDRGEGTVYLKQLLKDKASLLVLDDVWKSEHAAAFNVMGQQGQMLLTTRISSIVKALNADGHFLEVLSDDHAMELLAMTSETPRDELPDIVTEVAKECGNLPLALAAIGSMARDKPDLWGAALNSLKESDLEKLELDFPNCPHPNMMSSIQISVDALRPHVRERYMDFAVFPEDTPIPEAVLETFWKPEGMGKYHMQDVVDELVDRSMLRTDDRGWLSPHDFQFDYVRKQSGDLPALHNRLVDAYAEQRKDGWHTGPDDGYFFQYLPYHLKEAGRDEELRELLLNFNWLQAKLDATDVSALMDDYDHLSDDAELRLVRGAILLSAHVLAQDPTQLAGQLLGRLLETEFPGIQEMLKQAARYKANPCLLPMTSSLTPPGGPLVRTLSRHTFGVNSVALIPDSRFAISRSADNTLKVWDLETGKEVRTLVGHTGSVASVTVTPDSRFAIFGAYRELKVWDLETGVEVRTLVGHTGWVNAVTVTPDSRFAISGSADNTLKVWDLETGVEVRTLVGHTDDVNAVTVTPDSRFAISGSLDNTLKLWDLETGVEVKTLVGHTDDVNAVTVTPDSQFAISGAYRELKVWDLETGVEVRTLVGHFGPVNAVTVTPDSRFAISGAYQELKVWDLETWEEVRTLEGHTLGVNAVIATPDSRFAISGSADNTLKVWDLETGVEVRTLEGHTGWVSAVTVTPDSRFAISARSLGKTLKVWDLETGKEVRTLVGHTDWVKAVTVTPDSRFVISGAYRELKVWDLETGVEVRTLVGHTGWVNAVTVTPDSRFIISVRSLGKTLKVCDLETGKKVRTLVGHTGWVDAVTVTPDSRFAISGSADNTLKVWDLHGRAWNLYGRKATRTLVGHTESVNAVTVTSDSRFAISGASDSTVKVWDLSTGAVVASFSDDGSLYACAVAPDGRTIVAGGSSGQMHFLRLEGL